MMHLLVLLCLFLPAAASAQGSGHALRSGSGHAATAGQVDFGVVNSLTVMAWVKWNTNPSSGNPWATIVASNSTVGSGDDGQFWLQHTQTNGAFQFVLQTSTGRHVLTSTSSPQQGQWYHIAGVYTGSQILLYVNGVQEAVNTASGAIVTPLSTDHFSVGRSSNAANSFRVIDADIDEVSIWTSALSVNGLRAFMCKKAGGSESGLAGYWRFDEGSGSSSADITGNGNTLTLSAPGTQWICSSAPVGDASNYLYTTNWSAQTITLAHPSGDYLEVALVSGAPAAIHVILVDEAPNTGNTDLQSVSTRRYWIIHSVGGANPSYRSRYYYQGHPGIGGENQLRLATRNDNCATSWSRSNTPPNTGQKFIQLNSPTSRPQMQLILGTLNTNNPLVEATYRWIGGNASWTASGNWQPSRQNPLPDDILIFDNFNNAAVSVSDVPSETVSRIDVRSNADVTLRCTAAATLSIGDNSGDDLRIEAGSRLAFGGDVQLVMNFTSGATAGIRGTLAFVGNAGHRIEAVQEEALRFRPGGVLYQEDRGPVFGTSGVGNIAVFESGSFCIMQSSLPSALPPFGLAAPASKVRFERGSTYVLRSSVPALLPLAGRVYPNLYISGGTVHTVGQAFQGIVAIDTLSIEAGSALAFDHTAGNGDATISIAGDLHIDGEFSFAPDASVNYTLLLQGIEDQGIRGNGDIRLPSNLEAVISAATTEVLLHRDLTIECDFSVINGRFSIAAHTLRLDAALTVSAPSELYGGTAARLVFAGNSAATRLPAIEVLDLVINRTSGIDMVGDVTVGGTLDLQSGALRIADRRLIIPGSIATSSGNLTGDVRSTLQFSGTSPSILPSVTLGTLDMGKSGGVVLTGDVTVLTELILNDGIISVDDYHFIYGSNAVTSGSPGASSMLAMTGTGSVRRNYDTAAAFSFPIGDIKGSPDYSPLTADIISGAFDTGAYLEVRVHNERHPDDGGSAVALQRYWTLSEQGISGYSIDVEAVYVQTDVSGREKRLYAARHDGMAWHVGVPSDTSTNTLSFPGLSVLGDFTAIDPFPYLVISEVDGPWQDSDTWDAGRVPTFSDSVIVRHQVTLSGSAYCNGILIDVSGELGHDAAAGSIRVNGGWTNDNLFDAAMNITVEFAGRPDTVFGVDGASTTEFYSLVVAAPCALRQDISLDGELLILATGQLFGGDREIALWAPGAPFSILGGFHPQESRVHYAADGTQNITATSYHDLWLSAPGAVIRDRVLTGDITVWNILDIGPSSNLQAGTHRIDLRGAAPLQMTGGMFTPSASTVAYSGDGTQTVAALTYSHLLLGSSGAVASPPSVKSATGDIRALGTVIVDSLVRFSMGVYSLDVTGDLVQRGNELGGMPVSAGHLSWSPGGTLTFSGTGNSALYGNHSQSMPDVLSLVIEKDAVTDTVRFASTASAVGQALFGDNASIDVRSGVLDYGPGNVTATQNSSAFFGISSGAIVRSSGQHNFPVGGSPGIYGFAGALLQSGSKVELYGDDQDVAGADRGITSYGILKLSGTGTKTMTDDFNVSDSLILTAPVTFDDNGASLFFGNAAVLRYTIPDEANPLPVSIQTTGDEFPATNGPRILVLDNPRHVQLAASRSIAGGVEFLRGKFTLGANTLTLGPSAYLIGYDNTRFFLTDGNGGLKRSGVGSAPVHFPIGAIATSSLPDTTYAPLTISNTGVTDNFSARVQASIDSPPLFLNDVVNLQWILTEDTPGGGGAVIDFQWDAAQQGSSFNPSSSVVVNYHDVTWIEQSATVAGSDPYTATATLPMISKYFVSMAAALPVELKNFSASRHGSLVDLRWETATELLNQGFVVQRSTDATIWHTVAWIDGAGTSHIPIRYEWRDSLHWDLAGTATLHYRLIQVDADGSERLSPVITLLNDAAAFDDKLIENYPQPFDDATILRFTLHTEELVTLDIHDAVGRLVQRLHDNALLQRGTHSAIFHSATLPSGAYFCVLRTGTYIQTRILLKRR
jgi:hypothetical protein